MTAVSGEGARRGGAENQRLNSLGLSAEQLVALLDAMDKPHKDEDGNEAARRARRGAARWPFRVIGVVVRLARPDEPVVEVKMSCRNLSATGVGLLHSSFVHPGTRVSVGLPHPEKRREWVSGFVARCSHFQGVVHDVGVRFDAEIDIRGFVRPDPLHGLFVPEHVRVTDLRGTLLHVDDSTMDLEIVRHYLAPTPLVLRVARSGAEAQAILRAEPVGMVLLERMLPDMPATHLIRGVRDAQPEASVLMLSADKNDIVRKEVEKAGFDALIPKPIESETLLAAIAEFMRDPKMPASVQLRSATEREEEEASKGVGRLRSLRTVFARHAPRYIEQLEKALADYEPMDAYAICVQLRGTAPAVGLDELGELAAVAATTLSQTMNLRLIQGEIEAMIRLCKELHEQAFPGRAA